MKFDAPAKKKAATGTLETLEAAGKAAVSDALAKKRASEQRVKDELDAGFFFSVVFKTRKDRDDWCAKNGVKLIDGEYVYGDTFSMRAG